MMQRQHAVWRRSAQRGPSMRWPFPAVARLILLQCLSSTVVGIAIGPQYLDDRVAHYTFPHTLQGQRPLEERIVVLHIYMTWRTSEGAYYMRGTGFTDAAAERQFESEQAAQTAASEANPPILFFEDANGTRIDIEQTSWREASRPFALRHTLDSHPGLLKLRVEGTRLYYSVDLEALPYHDPSAMQHCVVNVMGTFHPSTEPHVAVAALLYHVQYHLQIGVNLTMMYVTSQFLAVLLASRQVQALVAAGNLHLILWHDFPEILNGAYWSQGLQNNHGILWNWGTGCYAAMIDLDEYITYDSMQHQSLISHLHTLGNFSRVNMYRHQMMCATCEDAEFQSWFGQHHRAHPLELYSLNTTVDPNLFGKQIVHPSYVYGWNVHRGIDFPGSPPHVNPGDSIWLRHIVNMFRTRSRINP